MGLVFLPMDSSRQLIGQMINMNRAMTLLGQPIYSDALCARLLAFAALSGTEDSVLNPALHGATMVAQDVFNIKGGEVPHPDKLPLLWKAMEELGTQGADAEWFPAFAERYNLPKSRWPLLGQSCKEWYPSFAHVVKSSPKPMARLRGDEDDDSPFLTKKLARLRGDDDDEPVVSTARLRE